MRVALVGAVRSTEVALRTLHRLGAGPAGVLTLSPDRSSRHSDYVDLGPVAEVLGIPLERSSSAASSDAPGFLESLRPDLLLVIGWSEIIPAHVVSAAASGAIGYHPAPLPLMRGRGVIPWTILLRRTETAGTLFWLTDDVDDGDIAYQIGFDLGPRETATSLYEKHMQALEEMLGRFAQCSGPDHIPRRPQVQADATSCAQRRPVDGLIDWSRPATEVDRLVRATTRPYPGARALIERHRSEVVIWDAEPLEMAIHAVPGQVVTVTADGPVVACGEGFLLLRETSDPAGREVELRVQDRLASNAAATAWWMWHRGQD